MTKSSNEISPVLPESNVLNTKCAYWDESRWKDEIVKTNLDTDGHKVAQMARDGTDKSMTLHAHVKAKLDR